MIPINANLASKAIVLTLALVGLLAWVWLPTAPADESANESADEKLDRYLQRLGLDHLRTVHLESMLNDSNGERAAELARRLSDLYARQMIRLADNPQQFNAMRTRAERFLHQYPQVDAAALRQSILVADYNLAKAEADRWLQGRESTSSQAAAARIFARIVPTLHKHRLQIAKEASDALDKADELSRQEPPPLAAAEWRQKADELFIRAQKLRFYAGWSCYYLGLTSGEPTRFADATQAFCDILGLDQPELSEVESDWIPLEVKANCLSLIGLAMSQAAAGKTNVANRLFAALDDPRTPPAILDYRGYHQILAMLNAGHNDLAERLAREQVASIDDNLASGGQTQVCLLTVRETFGPHPRFASRSTAIDALAELAESQRVNVVKDQFAEFDIDLRLDEPLVLHRWKAEVMFEKARKSQRASDYQAIIDVLQGALSGPGAMTQPATARRCRYLLAWSLYGTGKFTRAAEEAEAVFKQLMTALEDARQDNARQLDLKMAEDAAWLAVACYQKLMREDSAYNAAAARLLDAIQARFQGTPAAAKAAYQKSKLAETGDRITRLQKLAGDENWQIAAQAQFDMVGERFLQWQDANDAARSAAIGRLNDEVDRYLKMTADGAELVDRRIEAISKLLHASLNSQPANLSVAEEYLKRARDIIQVAGGPAAVGTRALRDYHYRELLFGRHQKDLETVRRHANWLAENALHTQYEQVALAELCQQHTKLEPTADDDRLQEAFEDFGRLTTTLGQDVAVLQSNKNARIALLNHAKYAGLLGRHNVASADMQRLAEAFPQRTQFVHGAALACFENHEYERSLEYWRVLLAGLDVNTDGWYEAKYYQLKCLAATAPKTAKDVFVIFDLSYPQRGGPRWRDRFDALGENLGLSASGMRQDPQSPIPTVPAAAAVSPPPSPTETAQPSKKNPISWWLVIAASGAAVVAIAFFGKLILQR